MKLQYSKFIVLAIAMLVSSCKSISKLREINIPKFNSNNVEKSIIEKKTIAISCNKGNIKSYTDEGWLIKDTKTQEVVCSWKTKAAKKGCNIDKDKGCKITIPDQMGEQKIFFLERKSVKDK